MKEFDESGHGNVSEEGAFELRPDLWNGKLKN